MAEGNVVGEKSSIKLPAPVILMQTYVLPLPIKALRVTKSRQGITNKHVIILTEGNKVLAIPGAMLNARRPGGFGRADMAAFENSEYPPYDPVVPISFLMTLSYDLDANGLQELSTLPHDYESTTLLIASGIDLFVNSFAPEKVGFVP